MTDGRQYHPRIQPGIIHPIPEYSATPTMTVSQMAILVGLVAALAHLLYSNFTTTLLVVNAVFILFYLGLSVYKFAIIFASIRAHDEVALSPDISAMSDDELPAYTILVPLHQECEQVAPMVAALERLDYPKERLEALFLLEESDEETVEFCRRFPFPCTGPAGP